MVSVTATSGVARIQYRKQTNITRTPKTRPIVYTKHVRFIVC